MNYRINNMSFIKAEEAKRYTTKSLQAMVDETLEGTLEELGESILNFANEGYDEIEREVEESRLVPALSEYLTLQGYKVEHHPEDEENEELLVISWKA